MLTEPQTQILQAAVNRIVPADDYPNAWDAGAGEFFHRLFEREPRFLPQYQAGLDALEAAAEASADAPFAALDAAAQDGLLRWLEAAEDTAVFFRLLVEQTLESYYADPGNGGNRSGVSWDMIGYKVTA
jgi:gluconate 2-dehydrogenase gamma chain